MLVITQRVGEVLFIKNDSLIVRIMSYSIINEWIQFDCMRGIILQNEERHVITTLYAVYEEPQLFNPKFHSIPSTSINNPNVITINQKQINNVKLTNQGEITC